MTEREYINFQLYGTTREPETWTDEERTALIQEWKPVAKYFFPREKKK